MSVSRSEQSCRDEGQPVVSRAVEVHHSDKSYMQVMLIYSPHSDEPVAIQDAEC